MFDNYNEYLVSATNAQVVTEWDGVTRYWCPSATGIDAEVVYGYDVGFAIETASVYAFLIAIDTPTSWVYLDVSPDMTNWTTVGSGYLHPPLTPIDVSDILKGSQTAYVRARMKSNITPIYAQFVRTNPGHFSPNVYKFDATGNNAVPEPASVAVWSLFGATWIGCSWWRKGKQ
jgi:hypothetical protein